MNNEKSNCDGISPWGTPKGTIKIGHLYTIINTSWTKIIKIYQNQNYEYKIIIRS